MQKALCLALFFSTSLCIAAQNPCSGNDETALRSAHLSVPVRNDILMVIEKELKDLDPEVAEPRKLALTSWVSCLELARSGPPAILVTSGPDHPATGATGNHELWLFRKVGSNAELILRDGGATYGPTSMTYHNGMRDFKTWGTMGGGQGGGEVFRFDGRRYLPLYCYKTSTIDGKLNEGAPEPCNAT
jgi:hypothetical protein